MDEKLKTFGIRAFWPITILCHIWGATALYFCSFPTPGYQSLIFASLYLTGVTVYVAIKENRAQRLAHTLSVFLIILLWFLAISPKKDASYRKDLEMPHADSYGDIITFYKIRNSQYWTIHNFDVRYEARTYGAKNVQTVDLLLSYSDRHAVAHVLLSFGFSDGTYLSVSAEAREEDGEEHGTLDGLFKQYELVYVWADERDSVRLRTNYRKEDVFLYRTSLSPEKSQDLFLRMVKRTNALYEKPEFYNIIKQEYSDTLSDYLFDTRSPKRSFFKRWIKIGAVDQRAFRMGLLEAGAPFQDLRKAALINERAVAADKDPEFSQKIRGHLKDSLQE